MFVNGERRKALDHQLNIVVNNKIQADFLCSRPRRPCSDRVVQQVTQIDDDWTIPLYLFALDQLTMKRRAPEVRFREGYGMTEMAPAVTFVRGSHLVTGGSTGQLVPNSSMKVQRAPRFSFTWFVRCSTWRLGRNLVLERRGSSASRGLRCLSTCEMLCTTVFFR